MTRLKKLLVIDDEENMRHVLQSLLEKEGYSVTAAENGSTALELLDKSSFDTILCDLRMPEMDGMSFLKQAHDRKIDATIIVMSAYGTIDQALETIQLGAYDYISKPFKPAEIIFTLKKAEERQLLRRENLVLKKEVSRTYSFKSLIGSSPRIRDVISMIEKVAPFKSSVLITGESGTGKELVARAIHYAGPRSASTFLAINCGAIPENLLESELFGHRKGAFTGAVHDRRGYFEEANGGTLLLDEIGEMPQNLQVKLLRALQEEEIRRVGEQRAIPVDVRVIASTSRNLAEEVARNAFRGDLLYRLNVLPIHIAPLRDRREDIPLLVEHFIQKHNRTHRLSISGITPAALTLLTESPWPGNVRELENTIERAMVLSETPVLDVPLPGEMSVPSPATPPKTDDLSIKRNTKILEKDLITRALAATGGNKSRAAKLLELSYPALLSKMTEYGLK
ncbi:MAG: sigma-54-dependent Fis family transcriptional regulator [Deltaproteobacteria bacterium]|nr:sigma-54-dependent Fis family transcriptional regulator [Deltaproteobacteria bacterium]